MRRIPKAILLLITLAAVLLTPLARADERLENIACRSVHLFFPSPECVAFYNDVTIERSAPGSYFMVCGWDKGYFGLQELGNGRKVVLFSVWDSEEQNDKHAVDDGRRVKTRYKDDKVRVGRFGGEGTGGQSFFDLDWKIGETYRLLVTAKPAGDRTEYTGYLHLPQDGGWKRLVTFSTLTGGKPKLRGLYSFIEDFKRDGDSAKRVRAAHFGLGWARDEKGEWKPLSKARFTADGNPAVNINAAASDEKFFLATGGDTRNAGAKLREEITIDDLTAKTPPVDLPAEVKAE